MKNIKEITIYQANLNGKKVDIVASWLRKPNASGKSIELLLEAVDENNCHLAHCSASIDTKTRSEQNPTTYTIKDFYAHKQIGKQLHYAMFKAIENFVEKREFRFVKIEGKVATNDVDLINKLKDDDYEFCDGYAQKNVRLFNYKSPTQMANVYNLDYDADQVM